MKTEILKPEKWEAYGGVAQEWWDSLSHDERVTFRDHYEKVRIWNLFYNRFPYPNMPNCAGLRVNTLSRKQLYRIWVFRDKHIDI